MKTFWLTFPFSLLGLTFVIIGLVLYDITQVYFGLVWCAIAVITFIWKKYFTSKKQSKL